MQQVKHRTKKCPQQTLWAFPLNFETKLSGSARLYRNELHRNRGATGINQLGINLLRISERGNINEVQQVIS
jgi:hypothetical protein